MIFFNYNIFLAPFLHTDPYDSLQWMNMTQTGFSDYAGYPRYDSIIFLNFKLILEVLT